MADFIQAIKWMREGKKVRSERYLEGDHFYIENNTIMFFGPGWDEPEKTSFEDIEDFEATDWEILQEKESLSDKIDDRDYKPIERHLVQRSVKDLKERIDKINLCSNASIQDYLIEAQDEVNKVFGDKLI